VVACGSGSGDAPSRAHLAMVETSAGDTSPPADSIATVELQRNAARNAVQGLSVNLGGMQSVSGNASTLANSALSTQDALFNDDKLNDDTLSAETSNDDTVAEVTTNDSLYTVPTLDAQALDNDIEHFLFTTLGVDESSNVQALREGNRITIDPDDATVCAADMFVDDADPSTADQAQCMQLVSHLSVQLDAVTEQRGEISFLFDNAPLLVLGYGPQNAWYEVKLGALHQVMLLAEQLGIEDGDVPSSMRGSVRVTASIQNSVEGQESGSFSLVIPEALQIEDNDGSRLSIAPSTVFTVASDAAAGVASIELGLGALDLLSPADNFDESATPTMGRLTMKGLTGRAELSNNGQQLIVSNVSFGRGPLRYSVDSQVTGELSLESLGFQFSEQTGVLQFNSRLAASFKASLSGGSEGNVSISARATAPAGTTLLADAEPNSLVQGGGPLSLNYTFTTPGNSESGFLTYSVGACQDTSNQTQADSLTSELFSCTQQ